jgi:hypothetical protein
MVINDLQSHHSTKQISEFQGVRMAGEKSTVGLIFRAPSGKKEGGLGAWKG